VGETVDQIADHIKSSREDLRSNLEALGHKAKSAVDWRERFRDNTGAALAVAFGGGFIVAKVIGGPRGRGTGPKAARVTPALAGVIESRKGQGSKVWDDIQQALVGVVAAKVMDTLAELVPGFKEQLVTRDDDERVLRDAPETTLTQ
jgi:hypothetical protein